MTGGSRGAASGAPRFALATASYRGDLERCRLLCRSIDERVSGFETHYILVEARDAPLFADLASPRRRIVSERDLLPGWLRPVTQPGSGRRLWLQPFGPPLRGWHVQQLRRLAFAAAMSEDAVVSLDSDVAFARPFDMRDFAEGQAVRFYRAPGAIAHVLPHLVLDHERWSRRAGRLLGIASPETTGTGYIATGISWRRDTVRDLLSRIEATSRRSAMGALAASRALSECTIYGRFVDEVENRPDRHRPSAEEICAVYWDGPPLDAAGIAAFLAALAPHQAAIGLQSFTGTDPALVRRALSL